MNTPDSFERKASSYKISMTTAFELDCSAIVGDVSHLILPGLVRISRFSKNNVTENCVRHEKYGKRLSDVAILDGIKVQMESLESAAIDSMMTMRVHTVTEFENGETELTETPDETYFLKLSSWVTRHLALFQTEPSDKLANMSAFYITEFMKKLGCPVVHVFPSERTEDLKLLDAIFRTSEQKGTASPPSEDKQQESGRPQQ
jgi:hypothetical protein